MTLDQVLRAPGVFQTDEELAGTEDLWPAVEKSLNHALAALLKMREREGAHLAKDLTARIGVMHAAVDKIQKQAPTTAENYRQICSNASRRRALKTSRRMTSGC